MSMIDFGHEVNFFVDQVTSEKTVLHNDFQLSVDILTDDTCSDKACASVLFSSLSVRWFDASDKLTFCLKNAYLSESNF